MNTRLQGILTAVSLLCAVALIAAGCRPNEELRNEPKGTDTTVTLDGISFRPELPAGSRLDTIIRADLNGNGAEELIVASLGADSLAPGTARADYLQIYTLDSAARRYRLVYADSLRWATGIRLQELNRSAEPELVVTTDGGGNDEIASRGISIYGSSGGTIGRLYQTSRGNPGIEQVHGPDVARIVIRGIYWPPFMTHAEAIRYVDDYLVFRGNSFVSVRREQQDRFIADAEEALGEYGRLREQFKADTLAKADTVVTAGIDSGGTPHPLFTPAALALIRMGRGGADRSLRSFWGSERDYLEKRLPPAQFEELESLYGEMIGGSTRQ